MGYKIVCLECGNEITLEEKSIQEDNGIRVSIISAYGCGNIDIQCECGNIFNAYE